MKLVATIVLLLPSIVTVPVPIERIPVILALPSTNNAVDPAPETVNACADLA